MKRIFKFGLLGTIAGVLNGIFGAGGGLLVVPMLESQKLEPKKAHATSIAVIFPLSVVSTILYLCSGTAVEWGQLGILIPLGAVGALLGAFLLTKVQNKWLKKLFGVVMILSAVRILLR